MFVRFRTRVGGGPISRTIILVLRGFVNAGFGLYLFTSPGLDWTEAFVQLGYYGAVDGVMALLLAAAVWAERHVARALLVAVTALDGLLRLALALAIWLAPGVPYTALTTLLFFATIAVCTSVIGGVWGYLALHGAYRAQATASALRWPLALASGASLILGAAMFFADPDFPLSPRVILASYMLALGTAFVAAGWHHSRPSQGS